MSHIHIHLYLSYPVFFLSYIYLLSLLLCLSVFLSYIFLSNFLSILSPSDFAHANPNR